MFSKTYSKVWDYSNFIYLFPLSLLILFLSFNLLRAEDMKIEQFYFDIANSETIDQYSSFDEETIESIIDSIEYMFWAEYIRDPYIGNENAKIQIQKAKAIIDQIEGKEEFAKRQKTYVDLLETYVVERSSEQAISLINELGDIEEYINEEISESRRDTISSTYYRLLTNLIISLSSEEKFPEALQFINIFDDGFRNICSFVCFFFDI